MIRKLLLTTTAFAALSGVALAADLPSRMQAPILAAPPVFTWTGFYVGSTVGGITLDTKTSNYYENEYNDSNRYTQTAVTVGGTIGYNYQLANIVLGLEADYNWANIHDNDYTSMNGFGTVRGRLGLAWDRALLYVTGGYAFADLKQSYYSNEGYSAHANSGWTIGTGVEYAIMPHVTIKLEGLYMDFGKKTANAGCGCRATFKNTATVGRVGLNYKF